MKIEQLIVQHLYNSKKVTLQDIGTFTLSPDVAIPFESDKDTAMPENAVKFELNKKARQDDDLIAFIVSQTSKIKPLATSDLESYSILANQFLNIGKPFPIEGLGVLQKTQSGEYEFLQGNSINAKLDAAPALLKEKTKDEISFTTQAREETPGKKFLLIGLLAIFIIAAAGGTYYFLKKRNKDNSVEPVAIITDTIVKPKDTIKNTTQLLATKPDSTAKATTPPGDSSTFKIVIKEYPDKAAADKAFTKLSSYGHKLVVYTKDSVTYKLAMPFTDPLTDTLHVRDSLQKFFGGKPYVEKN
jgi:hypothetical protein